jgi:hypothetical protein
MVCRFFGSLSFLSVLWNDAMPLWMLPKALNLAL